MPWSLKPDGIHNFEKCMPAFITLKVHDHSLGKHDLSLTEVQKGSDDRHKSKTVMTQLTLCP